VVLLVLDDLLRGPDCLLHTVILELSLTVLLDHLVEIKVLLDKVRILGLNLLLQLVDLVRHASVLLRQLGYLLLTLKQVLRVEITVTTHRLVEVLLMLELGLHLGVLLLQLSNLVVLDLDLLDGLVVFSMSL
jgi:hypothetical protein